MIHKTDYKKLLGRAFNIKYHITVTASPLSFLMVAISSMIVQYNVGHTGLYYYHFEYLNIYSRYLSHFNETNSENFLDKTDTICWIVSFSQII